MLNDNSTIKSNKSREEKKEQNEKANDYIELWAIENDACCNGKSHMHSYKNCCAFYKSTEHERQLNYEIIYFFFAPFVSSIFNTSNYQIAITLRCV